MRHDLALSLAYSETAPLSQFRECGVDPGSGQELQKLEDRAKAAQERVQQLKNQQKEGSEKIVCATLLKEAGDKLQQVAESISKAADAEAPFLMGVEELPLEETLSAVKGCEAAATSANTAVSIARMFIATKLVEAKRFSPGPSAEAQEKLKVGVPGGSESCVVGRRSCLRRSSAHARPAPRPPDASPSPRARPPPIASPPAVHPHKCHIPLNLPTLRPFSPGTHGQFPAKLLNIGRSVL